MNVAPVNQITVMRMRFVQIRRLGLSAPAKEDIVEMDLYVKVSVYILST